jgi:hypothetical protein
LLGEQWAVRDLHTVANAHGDSNRYDHSDTDGDCNKDSDVRSGG